MPDATPFSDLDAYLALPRVAGLALSPDGSRLVTTVATLDPDGVRWVTALWQVDPTGATPPARLTRSRKARKDKKVTAILHAGYPVRYWDHDLGPDQPRLLAGDVVADDRVDWTELTPEPGRALDEADFDVSADGSTIVTTWRVPEPHG